MKKVRNQGALYWAEQPEDPFNDEWKVHRIAGDNMNAHDVITADINGDGKPN